MTFYSIGVLTYGPNGIKGLFDMGSPMLEKGEFVLNKFTVFALVFSLVGGINSAVYAQDDVYVFSRFHSCSRGELGCEIDETIDGFFIENGQTPYDSHEFQQFLQEITTTDVVSPLQYSSRLVDGNHMEVIDTAERSYEFWNRLIENAKNHIHIFVYFIEDDVWFNKYKPISCPGAPKVFENSTIMCKLWRAAERGVKVRLITDSLGNTKSPGGVGGEEMVSALARHKNADVQNYNPVLAYNGFRDVLWENFKVWLWAQNRLHKKLMVVDGAYGITGGRNIGRCYMQPGSDHPDYEEPGDHRGHKYMDTEVYVEGLGVSEMQRLFLKSWIEYGEWETAITKAANRRFFFSSWLNRNKCWQERYYNVPYYCKSNDSKFKNVRNPSELLDDAELFPTLTHSGENTLRYIDSNPSYASQISENPFLKNENSSVTGWFAGFMSNEADDRYKGLSIGERLYIALIRNAKKSIKITNPYFILNQPLRSALWEAADLRGIKVEVLTNSDQSIDMPTMWKCSARDFETALENNIQIYEYFTDEGMLHSKTAIFDGEVGIIGSFNFDSVSYDSNTEALMVVQGDDIIGQMEEVWEANMRDDRILPMTRESFEKAKLANDLDGENLDFVCRNLGSAM